GRSVLQLLVLAEGCGPLAPQFRQAVVGLPLLFLFLLGLRRLGPETATAISEEQVEPAVAVPIDDARFDAQTPIALPAIAVAAPADRALADECLGGCELGLASAANIAIPDYAAVLRPHQEVELAVAIPIGSHRGRIPHDLDGLAHRFQTTRETESKVSTPTLVRDEIDFAEHVAHEQIDRPVAVPVRPERGRAATA